MVEIRPKPSALAGEDLVEERPGMAAEAPPTVENEHSARYALMIRKIKCYDGRRSLAIDTIIVQSPLIRDALCKVLDNYPGITTGIDRMEFRPKFQAFVHRWDKFRAVLENERDPTTRAHLQLLYDTILEEISADVKARDDMIARSVIDYDHLWMLFEPGSIFYAPHLGQPAAVRLRSWSQSGSGPERYYQLQCDHVDWNGENFGYANTNVKIFGFEGTCPISSLPSYPLKYHHDVEGVTARLVARGEEFERLAGYHYKAYEGVAVAEGLLGPIAFNIKSRVIIDTYAWNRFNPKQQVKTTMLEDNPADEAQLSPDQLRDTFDIEQNDEESLDAINLALKPSNTQKIKKLTRNQHLLCTNTVKGYALKDKRWLTLFVERIQEIKWSEHAFERLVLPEGQKEIILALTESQRENRCAFDDVIQGKGMGMIILLSGPPGTGKTLTAESVAENMKVPLYTMSSSDLGINSSEVETNLSNVLEMCTKWKGVLLLDEADVFLEQRSAHDLERNKLVSIFLRILEYYEGILFLTSNKVEHIDQAFRSRIHVAMTYEELSAESRRVVWNNLLSGIPLKHEIGEAELAQLAAFPMNGREIKNILRSAQLLASKKKTPLTLDHVQTVFSIEKRFVIGRSGIFSPQ